MKKSALALLLLFCSTLGQAKDKPTRDEFNRRVHISASHLFPDCGGGGTNVSCGSQLHADALMNGMKLELTGRTPRIEKKNSIILPGAYPEKLIVDLGIADNQVIYQEYDVLLPDNTVWRCYVSGISE
jgi:hypothetical protein